MEILDLALGWLGFEGGVCSGIWAALAGEAGPLLFFFLLFLYFLSFFPLSSSIWVIYL